MFKRIDHVEIVPSDAERSIEFCTNVIGFKVRQNIEVNQPPLRRVIYLTLGDTMLELLDVDAPEPPSTSPWQVGCRMMALEVEDMDMALTCLRCAGREPVWGPVELGDSIRAEVADPDGLRIELRQWRDPHSSPSKGEDHGT